MLLIKDIKNLCRLYDLDYNEVYAKRDNYLEVIKDVIEIDILQDTLNNLVYIKKDIGYMSEIRTNKDHTIIESVTVEEYNNIKNFDLNKLYESFSKLTLEEYKAQKIITQMIIPKIFIIHADKYNEKRYNNMLDRLFA